MYCLTVPGTERFTLANGVIVSNCADMVRYACMSRPYTRSRPKSKRGVDAPMTFNDLGVAKPSTERKRI